MSDFCIGINVATVYKKRLDAVPVTLPEISSELTYKCSKKIILDGCSSSDVSTKGIIVTPSTIANSSSRAYTKIHTMPVAEHMKTDARRCIETVVLRPNFPIPDRSAAQVPAKVGCHFHGC